jgi:hypothetical protein
MGHKRSRPSFETPRKRAAPQDDGMNVRLSKWMDARVKPAHDGRLIPRLP